MIRRLIILLIIVGCSSNVKKVISHYENGQIEEERNYKDWNRDGKYTKWYYNGQKKIEGTYKDGELISYKEWNEDGTLNEWRFKNHSYPTIYRESKNG